MTKFMNSENLEITNNIPEPDPDWDYYIIWHKLFKAKYKIEKLMKFVGEIENSTRESDQSIDQDLIEIVEVLETTRIA